ncbi:MAG: ABC transporter permease [Bacilli bacterium]|nr:ABC transporter permease [Bacilli bacterium]
MSLNNIPFFSILKRDQMPKFKSICIRILVVAIAFILSILFASLIIKENPLIITATMAKGAFQMPIRLLFNTAIILGFGIAIVPAFKMKYWNMGANGQVLMGCLVSCVIMFYLGNKMSNGLLLLLMFICSILVSVIWAIIPAVFKAFFNTNETLFTLMTNYIAATLVSYVNFIMAKGKQETIGVINIMTGKGWLPVLGNRYVIPIIVITLITIFIYIYMKKTKHGFEIAVLGDSPNTARYANMNTKLITIRTIALSGIICGIIGFLYASTIDHTVSSTTGGSLGFTGILVAWLSNFNPFIMAVISFILSFITDGSNKISSDFHLGSNNLSNVIFGIIFFSMLIAEFIIRYKVVINAKKKIKENEVDVISPNVTIDENEVKEVA